MNQISKYLLVFATLITLTGIASAQETVTEPTIDSSINQDNIEVIESTSDAVYLSNMNTLFKYDHNGNEVWSFDYDNPGDTEAIDIKNNEIVVSTGIELYKLDDSGNQIWQKTGYEGVSVHGIELDTNGNVYYGSQKNSSLIKLDSSGNFQWIYEKHSQKYSTYRINNIDIGDNGNIYTAGSDQSVHKIDPQGNQQWVYNNHDSGVEDVEFKNGYVYSSSWTIHKINSTTGTNEWVYGEKTPPRRLDVDSDGIYSANRNGQIEKIDFNGNNEWKAIVLSHDIQNYRKPISSNNGNVYTVTEEGVSKISKEEITPNIDITQSNNPINGAGEINTNIDTNLNVDYSLNIDGSSSSESFYGDKTISESFVALNSEDVLVDITVDSLNHNISESLSYTVPVENSVGFSLDSQTPVSEGFEAVSVVDERYADGELIVEVGSKTVFQERMFKESDSAPVIVSKQITESDLEGINGEKEVTVSFENMMTRETTTQSVTTFFVENKTTDGNPIFENVNTESDWNQSINQDMSGDYTTSNGILDIQSGKVQTKSKELYKDSLSITIEEESGVDSETVTIFGDGNEQLSSYSSEGSTHTWRVFDTNFSEYYIEFSGTQIDDYKTTGYNSEYIDGYVVDQTVSGTIDGVRTFQPDNTHDNGDVTRYYRKDILVKDGQTIEESGWSQITFGQEYDGATSVDKEISRPIDFTPTTAGEYSARVQIAKANTTYNWDQNGNGILNDNDQGWKAWDTEMVSNVSYKFEVASSDEPANPITELQNLFDQVIDDITSSIADIFNSDPTAVPQPENPPVPE